MARPVFIDVTDPPVGYGLTALVGDGTDETANIQGFFDLAQAAPSNNAVNLMFGAGRFYGISDSIDIHTGIGLRVSGGGFPHMTYSDTHDDHMYSAIFRALTGFSSKSMFVVTHHGGLVLEGLGFDGLDDDRTSENAVIDRKSVV